MRIAAAHKFINNKSRVINPSESLLKIATHPLCPLLTFALSPHARQGTKCSGRSRRLLTAESSAETDIRRPADVGSL